jgi:Helix-turn-helix of DDE superfamily endonuclease
MKLFTTRMLALTPSIFRRTFGVYPSTYQDMRAVLEERENNKKKQGRTPALDLDDQLILSLSFWREYRSGHHLSLEWEANETTIRRTVHRVEDALIKSGKFRLPGRKALRENTEFEVVVVDVAESPVERPKKSNELTTVGRRKDTLRKTR